MKNAHFHFAIALLCSAGIVHAGEVRCIDGSTYSGEVRAQGGQIAVASPHEKPVRLDVSEIVSAIFKTPDALAPPAPPWIDINRGWRIADVGPTGTPGTSWESQNAKFVKGAGSGIGEQADSFFFAFQQISGDGQIVAYLPALPGHLPHLQAGLMLREKFNERDSKMAFLNVTPSGEASLIMRREDGGSAASIATMPVHFPAWLRLAHVRDSVEAYASTDGKTWTQIGQSQELHMESGVFAGLAVCSGDPNAMAPVTFAQATVLGGRFNDVAPPQLISQAPPRPSRPHGVVLRNGSILSNTQIESADDRFVHLRVQGKPLTLAHAQISRLVLADNNWQLLEKIPAKASGVVTARGDFLEGDLQSLGGGSVQLNSVVLGPKKLAIGGEAVIVALHDVQNTPCAWEIKTTDGGICLADNLKIDRDQFVAQDQVAGELRLASWQVASIKSGPLRAEPLAPDHVTLSSANPLTHDLDGQYRFFTGHVSMPADRLPALSTQVIASVDGKEVSRSTPITAGESAEMNFSVTGGKKVSLQAETIFAPDLPCHLDVDEALLIK